LRIDKLSSEILRLIGEEVQSNGKRTKEGKGPSLSKGDSIHVNISEEIRQIEVELPTKEKVEKIKKAIAEGRYKIDVHKISESIIKEIIGE